MTDRIEMHIRGVVPEKTLENFKALVKAEIAIERADAHALRKEWFLDDNRAFRVIVVCESSAAFLHYFEGLEARDYGDRFDEVSEYTHVEIFGHPSNAVREFLETYGDDVNDKIAFFSALDGFSH